MRNHSKDKQEQVAIDYHNHYYKTHVFYIGSFEEYLIMEPFIKMFRNVRLVLARKLRGGVLDRMIAECKKGKPRPHKKYKSKLRDNYIF